MKDLHFPGFNPKGWDDFRCSPALPARFGNRASALPPHWLEPNLVMAQMRPKVRQVPRSRH